jgi:drug/metabolite transporter (DMT)-like permease
MDGCRGCQRWINAHGSWHPCDQQLEWADPPVPEYRTKNMLTGILMGLGAGALWGLTFVAPRAVHPYAEIDLAILRYGVFGLTSLVLMAFSPKFRPGKLTLKRIALALWLGLSGFVVYYLFVAYSVSLAGPAIAPLVIGALPVMLAIYGNATERVTSWGAIAVPLGLIALGLAIVNFDALRSAGAPEDRSRVLLGLAFAVLGLLNWFLYAITNARAMRSPDAPHPLAWTSLQGLGAMAGTIPLAIVAPLMGWSRIPDLGFAGPDGTRLLVWAIATGVIASWVAQYFWTVASHRLPLALSAQLIVAETLFALLYGFAFERRWPHAAEWAGAALLLAGVIVGVRLLTAGPDTTAVKNQTLHQT